MQQALIQSFFLKSLICCFKTAEKLKNVGFEFVELQGPLAYYLDGFHQHQIIVEVPGRILRKVGLTFSISLFKIYYTTAKIFPLNIVLIAKKIFILRKLKVHNKNKHYSKVFYDMKVL